MPTDWGSSALADRHVTAQDTEADLPTRNLACNKKTRKFVTAGQPKRSGIPCTMVLPLIRALQSAGLDSLRRPQGFPRIPASADQDYAILPSAFTPFVRRLSASTAFHPNVRDGRETAPDSVQFSLDIREVSLTTA